MKPIETALHDNKWWNSGEAIAAAARQQYQLRNLCIADQPVKHECEGMRGV